MLVGPICKKCRRRNIVSFRVEPKQAWRAVVLTIGRQFARPASAAEAGRADGYCLFQGELVDCVRAAISP
jgi:hypothetical protein